MRYELIKTQNYLLVVSDEKIKDVTYTRHSLTVSKHKGSFYYHDNKEVVGKIVCHKPLNGAPYLDGVDVLPEIEDEVEKLSIAEAEKLHDKDKHDDWSIYHQLIDEDARLIKLGFNKAKKRFRYTEDDLRKAVEYSIQSVLQAIPGVTSAESIINSCIQSINQPKLPIAFESEMEEYGIGKTIHIKSEKYKYHSVVPKSIINTNGQTEWVGSYIFND